MPALIMVSNSDGVVRRCDAKCYDATHPACDCVCGGINHGAGLAAATWLTHDHAVEMVTAYIAAKGIDARHVRTTLGRAVRQPLLFPEERTAQPPKEGAS